MKRSITALIAGSLLAISFTVFAAGGAIEGVEKQPLNISAIAMFMVFVLATLGITKWAAGKNKSTADFYTAGGGITGFQNGLAIAGDYMSAATLLGPGNHGTTFGGNPVSMAAGLAVISTIESEGLLNATSVRGDQIADGLLANNWVNEVTGAGLLRGIVLAEPRAVEIQQAALAAGLILNAPTADRLRIAPPLVLSEDEAANAVKTLSTVIDEVMK